MDYSENIGGSELGFAEKRCSWGLSANTQASWDCLDCIEVKPGSNWAKWVNDVVHQRIEDWLDYRQATWDCTPETSVMWVM